MTRALEGASEGLAMRSSTGRIALAAAVGASSMASLDATIVYVALPHIGSDLDASVASLQWVLTGYLVALASLILLAGALGDRFGQRRIFVTGTVWFAVASALCAIAPTSGALIGARVLQGVGGALLTPGSMAILQASFRPSDRAAALGAWSGLSGVAVALGPFVGGFLIDGPGWRWAFLLNLPVATIVIACTYRAIEETRDEHARDHLDVRGAGYTVLALTAGTLALTESGERGWADPLVLTATAVAVSTAVAFVSHLRRAVNPLIPLDLFRDRTFAVVNAGTLLLYAAIGPAFFLVAYLLQVGAGWTALEAGAALLPTTLTMLLFSSRSGALAQRIGPRSQLGVGPILTGSGMLVLSRVGDDPAWMTSVLPGSLLLGAGLVTYVAPLTASVMASADPDHIGTASGVSNAVARAAGLIGLATIPAVAGLTSAAGSVEVTAACSTGLVIAGVVAASAGPLMWIGLGPRVEVMGTSRRVHCELDAPPLQASSAAGR